MSKAQEYIDSVVGNTHNSAVEIIEQLEAENEMLKRNIQLHGGDICSLNNEVSMLVGKNNDLEAELAIANQELAGYKATVKRLEQEQERNRIMKNETKTIELTIECPDCHGTGLYVGMAERDGAAMVCHKCDGTGCYDYKYQYKEFVARKTRKDVVRVFGESCGFVHSSHDVTTKEGVKIEFSKGGVSYAEWLAGKKPAPIKELYCPMQWTRQKWKSSLHCKDNFWCGFISECPYRQKHGLKPCWDEYDKDVEK